MGKRKRNAKRKTCFSRVVIRRGRFNIKVKGERNVDLQAGLWMRRGVGERGKA